MFEQQGMDGHWQSIPWDVERVAADRWSEVVTIGDTLWAATPAGLIGFKRRSDGAAFLDPDSVQIVREPAGSTGLCPISDRPVGRRADQPDRRSL